MTIFLTPVYKRAPIPAIPYPRFGAGILPGSPNNNDYINLLANTMTKSVSGSTFTINDDNSSYMYFATPVENGAISFTDTSTGLQGGWDGATWPTNGTTAQTTGPITVSLTFDGDTRDWYVYRTDFSSLGTKTYRINFDGTPVSLRQEADPDPGIGYADITTAIANAITIVPDGPAYVAKMQGQQYLAFKYMPKSGRDHIHNAIGTGAVTLRLYGSSLLPVTGIIDSNNGPNGTDEINFRHASRDNFHYLLVNDTEASASTITDFSVNVVTEAFSALVTGQDDALTALASPTDIVINTPLDFTLSESKFAAFKFDLSDNREHEFRVIADGHQNVEYEIYQDNVSVYGPISANNGPGGQDEIGNGLVLNKLTTGPENLKDDAYIVVRNVSVPNVSNVGAGFVFNYSAETLEWIQSTMLVPSILTQDSTFGELGCISDDGNTIAVCAPASQVPDTGHSGALYIFVKENGFFKEKHLIQFAPTVSGTNPRFGASVAINANGSRIFVGAHGDNLDGNGAASGVVYVIDLAAENYTMTKVGVANTAGADRLGYSVACSASGNSFVSGAVYKDKDEVSNSGAAYVFEFSGSWINTGLLEASEAPILNANVGYSVSMSGDGKVIAVSSNLSDQRVRIYKKISSWLRTATITPVQFIDKFGYSTGLNYDGKLLCVGASGKQVGSFVNCGSIFIYTTNDHTFWNNAAEIDNPDPFAGARFGFRFSLSISQDNTIVTSSIRGDDGDGDVYVIKKINNVWQVASSIKTPSSAPALQDSFARYCDITSDGLTILALGSFVDLVSTENLNIEVKVVNKIQNVRHGVGNLVTGFDGTQALTVLTNTTLMPVNGISLGVTITAGNYAYFAIPVAQGQVKFTDKSNYYEGAWDGASWPNDGNIGQEIGPVTISMTVDNITQDWYVYRTDFSSLGNKTYLVQSK
jgi:hypothetical protein